MRRRGRTPPPAPQPVRRRWAAAVPLPLVALVTVAAFLPALRNGFVWDDLLNFVENPAFRDPGWDRLAWMLTTTHMGHWVPLTWMTLALDHR